MTATDRRSHARTEGRLHERGVRRTMLSGQPFAAAVAARAAPAGFTVIALDEAGALLDERAALRGGAGKAAKAVPVPLACAAGRNRSGRRGRGRPCAAGRARRRKRCRRQRARRGEIGPKARAPPARRFFNAEARRRRGGAAWTGLRRGAGCRWRRCWTGSRGATRRRSPARRARPAGGLMAAAGLRGCAPTACGACRRGGGAGGGGLSVRGARRDTNQRRGADARGAGTEHPGRDLSGCSVRGGGAGRPGGPVQIFLRERER